MRPRCAGGSAGAKRLGTDLRQPGCAATGAAKARAAAFIAGNFLGNQTGIFMGYKVLFVDDNAVIRKLIEQAFKNEPYTVLLAENARDALALVALHHPSVIVTDLRMPGMNGLELLRKARSIRADWIGMIFTAYLDIDCVIRAVSEEYVWRYIIKPWKDNRELLLAVRNALQLFDEKKARRRAERRLIRAERFSVLERLIAGVAHQFNNINVGIFGYAQMARKCKGLPAEADECLENITMFARRATEIIHDLVAFTDQSSKKGFAPASLSALARDAATLLAKECAKGQVVIETLLAETPAVEIDYGLIRHLVFNLLSNAIDATAGCRTRKICIETGASEDRVFVKVYDNGCGIPADKLGLIFDPFFSTKGPFAPANTPQAQQRGVGLGLSLSQTIAETHGGEITVESREGEGATFTLWLPLAREQGFIKEQDEAL